LNQRTVALLLPKAREKRTAAFYLSQREYPYAVIADAYDYPSPDDFYCCLFIGEIGMDVEEYIARSFRNPDAHALAITELPRRRRRKV